MSSHQVPVNRLSGVTLGLLFTGSAVLLTGPLVWRGSGLYVTNLGRGLTLEVGFSFIGFALASTVVDLRPGVLGTVVTAVSAFIAARAVVDFWRTRELLRKLDLSALVERKYSQQ